MKNIKVSVVIGSQQKGFLIAIAQVLEKKYKCNVNIIARDKGVKSLVDKLLPERVNRDNVLSEIYIENYDVLEEMRQLEVNYKITGSMLLSEDRALGQGYLFNVEKIPNIKRSNFSNEFKLNELLVKIKKMVTALNNSDIVIGHIPDSIIYILSQSKNIAYLCPTLIKFGDRIFWSDSPYLTSKKFIDRVLLNLSSSNNNEIEPYRIETSAQKNHSTINYKYSFAIKQSLILLINELKKYILGNQKKDSYGFCGWMPNIYRKVRHYKFIKRISVNPNEVREKYRIVYFSLHLEPEIALQSISPEFNNSLEVISWISKSLPANTILIVKEHPFSFGVRSIWFYRQINKISNVMWAEPTVHSWDWIKNADIVVAISGTAGIESVQLNKPVISFGKHQVINYLPTVRYVSNFDETRKAVSEILEDRIPESDYLKSKLALTKAQIDSSFELPEYKNNYKSDILETEMAATALENLFSEYPNLNRE
jgi:capsule polysaccharide modification protein KpsS